MENSLLTSSPYYAFGPISATLSEKLAEKPRFLSADSEVLQNPYRAGNVQLSGIDVQLTNVEVFSSDHKEALFSFQDHLLIVKTLYTDNTFNVQFLTIL